MRIFGDLIGPKLMTAGCGDKYGHSENGRAKRISVESDLNTPSTVTSSAMAGMICSQFAKYSTDRSPALIFY
jgi:hypothetical protein